MDQTNLFRILPEKPRDLGFFIDGVWHSAEDRGYLPRSSPGYGIDVTNVTLCTAQDVDRAVQAARNAFSAKSWAGMTGAGRAAVLLRTANLIRSRVEELAYWETLETGKPISQSRAEVEDGA